MSPCKKNITNYICQAVRNKQYMDVNYIDELAFNFSDDSYLSIAIKDNTILKDDQSVKC